MYNSRSQSPSSRIMDKLQQQYNQQAQQKWFQGKRNQNLYYKIAQMEQASMSERKSMEKQLKQKQDNKIKAFWKAEEERYREMQRRKKEEVDNVRKVNNNLSLQIQQQSKEREEFLPFNNHNDFIQHQILKQKKQKEQFLKQGTQYQKIKMEQQKFKKMMEMQVENLKLNERSQIQRKRQADLKRIRDKHQQNFSAYHYLDEKLRQRQAQQNMLESYIVNKGQNDQQARLLELRAQFEAKQKQRKQNYMKDLKGQLEGDTYRHIYDRKNEIDSQKNLIEQRNRYFSEVDKFNKMRKSQEDKKMLQILKNQVKPRKLIPDPDTPEKIGLGSPVNIGKVIGDDRKRQLEWIQKSLLRQIHY